MRKLRLDVEELAVQSFEPTKREEAKRGTVRAHAVSNGPYWTCAYSTCPQGTVCCPSHHNTECC